MTPEQKQLIREKWWSNAMQKNGNNYDPAIAEIANWWLNELDLVMKQTEERIVEKIQEMPNANINEVQNEKVISAEVIITLIRNK